MRWTAIVLLIIVAAVQLHADLRVSANGRHLVDANGDPFLMVGDAGWSLIVQLSREDADYYLQARAEKGFNTVLVNLIDNEFGSSAPANFYGNRPFTGPAFSSAPNEAYFTHADYIINSAAAKGIVFVLCPVYLGYSASEGWSAEVNAASADDMRAWGRFLGNRYKDKDNIIWCIGGDTNPSAYRTKLREVVSGVQEYDDKIWTSHNTDPRLATDYWTDSWMVLDNVYTYDPCGVPLFQTAYNRTPTRPVFFMETRYENERYYPSAQELRSQAYYSVLAGGFGHIYGNCPVWHFGSNAGWCGTTNWKGQLGSAGTNGMYFFQKALGTRAWHEFVPDYAHVVMTNGYGSLASWSTDYAATASSAKTIMAYLPSSRTVTVNPAVISGATIQVWWYNPSTGQTTDAGQLSKTSRTYTPPSAGDWLLVIDDAELNLPPPGEDSPVPVLVAPVNGALHLARPVELVWRSYAGAASYQVQVATSPAFTTIVHDASGTDTTRSPGGLAPLSEYSWRVRSAIAGGESPWSATWSFATKDTVPVRLASFAGTGRADGTVLLEWTTTAETDNQGFEVQRSPLTTGAYQTLPGSFRAGQGTATGLHAYAFTDSSAYAGVAYYRLRQISLDNSEQFFGEVRVEPVPLSAPVLQLPQNGAIHVPAQSELVWRRTDGAIRYTLQLASDASFSSPVLEDSLIADTLRSVTGLQALSAYHWRVRAMNLLGPGPWSTAWVFVTQDSLPIRLDSFTGTALPPGIVRLEWTTLTETGNQGFEAQRSPEDASSYATLPGSFIPGQGTTTEPHSYVYVDSTPYAGVAYYRLRQISMDASVRYFGEVRVEPTTSVGDGEVPTDFRLHQNTPNPFNPGTTIFYDLPVRVPVRMVVATMLGQVIRVLVQEEQAPGRHSVMWDGRDQAGRAVSSGVYLYRLEAGDRVASRKMVYMR